MSVVCTVAPVIDHPTLKRGLTMPVQLCPQCSVSMRHIKDSDSGVTSCTDIDQVKYLFSLSVSERGVISTVFFEKG